MGHAAAGAVHVLLFAGLARAAGSVWPERISRGFLWLGLALLAAVVETIQPLVGRSAGWADWLYGAGGAACLCGGWPLRPGTRRRWVALGALALFPPVWEAAMWHQEIRAFPVLAQSGAWWARRSWMASTCLLIRTAGSRWRDGRRRMTAPRRRTRECSAAGSIAIGAALNPCAPRCSGPKPNRPFLRFGWTIVPEIRLTQNDSRRSC